jgi:hypothetical protein
VGERDRVRGEVGCGTSLPLLVYGGREVMGKFRAGRSLGRF